MPPHRLPLTCAPLLCGWLLAACTGPGGSPGVARLQEPAPIDARGASGPPDAAPGTCWGRDETPARLETITREVAVAPAGAAAEPRDPAAPLTRRVTRQRIVEDRSEIWFETPCPDDLTPDTIASLQRALAARGLYDRPITGTLTAETRSAIRRYQAPLGLDSAVLSLVAARQLGLAPVAGPPDTGAPG